MRSEVGGKAQAARPGGLLRSWMNRLLIVRKDRGEARERALRAQMGPTVEERQDELVRFYDRFEALVENLCDAAQFGPTTRLEQAYAEHRAWFDANYPRIRPFVLAYLRLTPEDAEAGLALAGKGTDAFEALVAAPTLADLLRLDDGSTIPRITRSREALNMYGEHLRQLAARKA